MSTLTFLPAPWFLAVPDFEDASEPQHALPPLLNPLGLWRFALAAALALALAFPTDVSAQISPSPKARKIYAKLQRFAPQAEVEVRLRNSERIQGRLASFDQTTLRLDGMPDPIPLDDIANVKLYAPRNSAPAWNPATGFLRGWKSAAIVGGLLVGVIVLVATNTE